MYWTSGHCTMYCIGGPVGQFLVILDHVLYWWTGGQVAGGSDIMYCTGGPVPGGSGIMYCIGGPVGQFGSGSYIIVLDQ